MRRKGVAAALASALLLLTPAPAGATAAVGDDQLDPVMVELLREVPGGEIIDAGHAVWPELDMALIIPQSSEAAARSVGLCATGKICAYDQVNRGGRVLTWGVCGPISVPSGFAARSAANARTSGHMNVRNGTSVLVSISANTWANFSGTATNILCYI